MECPVCKVRLIAVERQGIEVDYCPSCRGFWFDSGEIELLLEHVGGAPARSEIGSSVAVSSRERPRRCPRCGKQMEKIAVGRSHSILLDRCAAGEGYWFDARELGLLLDEARPAADGGTKVFNFLGELFSGPDRGPA